MGDSGMGKNINSGKGTEAIGFKVMVEDWKKLPEFQHKFYPIPEIGKEDIRELFRELCYMRLEVRRTRRGERVYTYVVPILRKETTITGNEWSPGLLFLKYHVRGSGEPVTYYSIVKIDIHRLNDLIEVLNWLKRFAEKPTSEWDKLPTVSIDIVSKIIALREGLKILKPVSKQTKLNVLGAV